VSDGLFTATAGEIQGLAEALSKIEGDSNAKIRALLEAVGIKTVAFLRSTTGKTRPPIRSGGAPRPAHPGEWADISGQLALAYDKDVQQGPNGGYRLVLTNGAEYAAALEARDGFYVLSGVTDRGGPVETALRQAVQEIAPDWVVQSYD
jgi:hypothetical protein